VSARRPRRADVRCPTAALFRSFIRLVELRAAARIEDGAFVVLDEQRWHECLIACEGAELP
jgi:hypothetical protein